jgi:DNA-binding transcriptional regulator YiaG
MNTFSTAFRAEVIRMARKELKPELQGMRKAITSHRSEIAALKREVKALASQLKATSRLTPKAAESKAASAEQASAKPPGEFQPEVLRQMRTALGITQTQLATLLGVSSLSVYKWETRGVTPRAAQRARIDEVRRLGPSKALAALAQG